MLGGVALTMVPQLWVIILGMVVMTGGFFASHAVASGWSGALAVAGRSQSASLYNVGYYGGSSLFGYVGGIFLASAGWAGTVGMVILLTVVATILVTAVLPWERSG